MHSPVWITGVDHLWEWKNIFKNGVYPLVINSQRWLKELRMIFLLFLLSFSHSQTLHPEHDRSKYINYSQVFVCTCAFLSSSLFGYVLSTGDIDIGIIYFQVNAKQMSNREKIKLIHHPANGICLSCLFYVYILKSKNWIKLFCITLYCLTGNIIFTINFDVKLHTIKCTF